MTSVPQTQQHHQQPKPSQVTPVASHISDLAVVSKNVTLGHGCFVHPNARIDARNGPIVFGEYCVIEEYATISNEMIAGDKNGSESNDNTLYIGDRNVFRVGCKVRARRVGKDNYFDVRCRVHAGVVVGDGCTVRMATVVDPNSRLPDRTIVVNAPAEILSLPDAVAAQRLQDRNGKVAVYTSRMCRSLVAEKLQKQQQQKQQQSSPINQQ
eukprot:PhM_4_TR16129/c0_g1_i1/m.31923/K10428/DCTN6; dynactin 6